MFLKICPISQKIMEGVSEIHEKFMGPTDIISRCYANAN